MTELSLHILDIIQNSIVAKADLISIAICEDLATDQLTIEIADNGKGIDAEILKNVADPFYTSRTTRKVGMGLSLFRQAAEQCEGTLTIESKLHSGTKVKVMMKNSHIDKQPMGDIAGVVSLMVASNPAIDFEYRHQTNRGVYEFNSREIKQELDEIPISDPKIVKFMREMIQENLNEINISK